MAKKKPADVIVVPDGKMLSDVIDRLPDGIIDKEETGIGATTCELKSPRNSIIVVPTRALALSKMEQIEGMHYVGSAMSGLKRSTKRSILAYHNKKSTKPKKFIAVADSFPKIVEAIGHDVYSQYFLMIDEVDSFQQESTFRSSMEDVVDYYFNFLHRCAVSATYIDFHNENFKKEPFTVITKKNKVKHSLQVDITNSVVQHTARNVTEYLHSKPSSEKVLVACASIQLILKIIGQLDEKYSKDCKVLCSGDSRDDVDEYYGELIKGKLPARLCFMTGAYFAGLDIYEQYHAVIAINFYPPHAILTTQKIRQIFGRSRDGLFSRLVIAPKGTADKINIPDLRVEINKLVRKFLGIEKCFEVHMDEDAFSIATRRRYKEMFLKSGADDTLRLVRLNKDNEYVRADFSIDALINMRKDGWLLWGSKGGFKRAFGTHFKVKEESFLSYPEDNAINPIDANVAARKKKILEDCLKEFEAAGYDQAVIFGLRDDLIEKGEFTGYKSKIYQTYLQLDQAIINSDVLRLMKEKMADARDSRSMSSVIEYIRVMGNNSDPLRGKLFASFVKNKKYTAKDLVRIYSRILRELTVHTDQLALVDSSRSTKLSENNVRARLGVYVELKRRKAPKGSVDSSDRFEVLGFNPHNISFKTPMYFIE